jgi:hypothetical protein
MSGIFIPVAIIEISILLRALYIVGMEHGGSIGDLFQLILLSMYNDFLGFAFTRELFAVPAMVVFAWLPLFGLGLLMLITMRPLSITIEKMQWFLREGKDHPLDAVGYMAGGIVFIIAAVWQFFIRAAASG